MNGVALNCRFSGTLQPTGTQTAAFALFDAIVRMPERECRLTIFADPRFAGIAEWSEAQNVTLVEVPFSRWSRGRAQLWEQMLLPGLCRKAGCTVAHHPITTSPFLTRGVKNVVTLHDLNFLTHPEWYSRAFRAVYSFTAIPGLMRAARVVAISDYVREQAGRRLGIEANRIRRIYNGVRFSPDGESFAHSDVPYLLSVGALQPHKNLKRLILAFRQLREWHPELELWIAGRMQPGFSAMPGLAELLETPGLQMLGYLSDEELRASYANALAFCYPSLEEGFGLPILEAMACGTLVVAANVSCLPEISGGHAEMVDPLSPESIASGVETILRLTPGEREERISRARSWAEGFNWQHAAWAYLAIYQELDQGILQYAHHEQDAIQEERL
jgi:glycosyltransferase involved in cell wall biosynthesis